MFFIPLVLSAGLDLTLPEFTPELDPSGNVIVGYIDQDESVVVDIPFEDISINDVLTDDISSNESVVDVSTNNSKRSIDISFNDKAPAIRGLSTEPVRSISIPEGYEAVYLTVETLANIRASSQSPYPLQSNSAGSYYVTLTAGQTYYISTDAPNLKYYTSLSIGTNGTVVTGSSDGTSTTYTPTVTTYFLVADTRSISAYYLTESSSGVDITGNDYGAVVDGLATINDSINTNNESLLLALEGIRTDFYEYYHTVINIFRAILMVLLFIFLYPIALSIVKNIVGGDSNV